MKETNAQVARVRIPNRGEKGEQGIERMKNEGRREKKGESERERKQRVRARNWKIKCTVKCEGSGGTESANSNL